MLQLDIHPMFLVDIPSIRPISGLFQLNISCFIIFQKGCSKYGYLSPSVDTVKYPGSWILIHSLYKSMVSILFKSCSYEFFNTMLSVFIYIYIYLWHTYVLRSKHKNTFIYHIYPHITYHICPWLASSLRYIEIPSLSPHLKQSNSNLFHEFSQCVQYVFPFGPWWFMMNFPCSA